MIATGCSDRDTGTVIRIWESHSSSTLRTPSKITIPVVTANTEATTPALGMFMAKVWRRCRPAWLAHPLGRLRLVVSVRTSKPTPPIASTSTHSLRIVLVYCAATVLVVCASVAVRMYQHDISKRCLSAAASRYHDMTSALRTLPAPHTMVPLHDHLMRIQANFIKTSLALARHLVELLNRYVLQDTSI